MAQEAGGGESDSAEESVSRGARWTESSETLEQNETVPGLKETDGV